MSGLKIGPAESGAGEKADAAAVGEYARVMAGFDPATDDPRNAAKQADLEGAIAKAHVEAEERQRFSLHGLVDLHAAAIMHGDPVAAEVFITLLGLVGQAQRIPLIRENRATEVLQGLRLAAAAMRYLEERIEARGGRDAVAGERAKVLARHREELAAIEKAERERLDLRRPTGTEDPLTFEAVQPNIVRGTNSQMRGLTPEQREAEERQMRERAREMQRERDGRAAAADLERRRQAGHDVEGEDGAQQQSDEALQARIEAEERLKARRMQSQKNAGGSLPGGMIGAGEELSYEEVLARAHRPAG